MPYRIVSCMGYLPAVDLVNIEPQPFSHKSDTLPQDLHAQKVVNDRH